MLGFYSEADSSWELAQIHKWQTRQGHMIVLEIIILLQEASIAQAVYHWIRKVCSNASQKISNSSRHLGILKELIVLIDTYISAQNVWHGWPVYEVKCKSLV